MQDERATTAVPDGLALRQLIQRIATGDVEPELTDDVIFVSGAYPRPVIGRAQLPDAETVPEAHVQERRNERKTEQLERLVIAASGDLAYDFGNFTLRFEVVDCQPVQFGGSYLRVWRKRDGAWLVDAWFLRPNEDLG